MKQLFLLIKIWKKKSEGKAEKEGRRRKDQIFNFRLITENEEKTPPGKKNKRKKGLLTV